MIRERRFVPIQDARVSRRADGKVIISGYSALFNVLSEEIWGFREKIDPGAFSSAITGDVRGLFNHEPSYVLGRTPKTLALREDDKGLYMEAEAPDTTMARDVAVLIERGDVTGQSFSFTMDYNDDAAETWEYDGQQVVRTIRKISVLYDVGPVTFPAYADTDVQVDQRMVVPECVRAKVEEIRKAAAKPTGRSIDFARRRLNLRSRA